MASGSLLALIDDIATLLDDVSLMTKVAAKRTAGLVGDELAVGAEQATGFGPRRELPVVWAVAKGAALNKVIIIPAALAISAFMPWAILPLLMVGGAYLSYEGAQKVVEKLFRHADAETEREALRKAFRNPGVDLVAFEKRKIRGAIRTDFILSAEIIVLALAAIAERGATLPVQLGTLIAIGAIVTVGVYGLVGGIVRIDDLGLYLLNRADGFHRLGQWLVDASPVLMKTLAVVGTVAMLLVGGGILVHGIAPLETMVHYVAHSADSLSVLVKPALNGVIGLLAGAAILGLVFTGKCFRERIAGRGAARSDTGL